MNLQVLLDQVLESGASALGDARQAAGADLGKYATGAAVGGVLGLLLGSRRGRNVGAKALGYGSMAAIGALAWKTYQDYQASQRAPALPDTPAAGTLAGSPAGFDALPSPEVERHGRAMLKAMIAAAKADGHMDDHERQRVQAELDRMSADDATRRWVDDELRRPVDPADVAAGATTPEQAAELYLVTLLVVDETTIMERAYLDELARRLQLAPELKADLERRAAAA